MTTAQKASSRGPRQIIVASKPQGDLRQTRPPFARSPRARVVEKGPDRTIASEGDALRVEAKC
jgi:hypothetical protein